ncbi:RE1 [Symbiodinium sp. CCMP2592]|nr:RE1 [Symbiodinium sp. CCMP2592]
MKTYQPGGLVERGELLKGLTNLDISSDAPTAVGILQKWCRHLDRAKSMQISVPDSSLLLQGIDKSVQVLLQSHPSLSFRMYAVRMQLQLDTVPDHNRVEEYVAALLAEFELLAVAMPDSSAKRQRVAAVDKGKGSHAKAECTAPGGGSAQKGSGSEAPKGKGKPSGGDSKGGAKPGAANAKAPPSKPSSAGKGTSGLSEEAIKEAAQLLQSLRLASLSSQVRPLASMLCRVQSGEPKGLIDGGATTCLRTARHEELHLPEIQLKLAYGECTLLMNEAGVLLSRSPVSPIVSVRAVLSLGYKLEWNNAVCRIWHPVEGDLDVDVQSGCPEISETQALDLIDRFEQLVHQTANREARMSCLMRDMIDLSKSDLAALIIQRDVQADAALRKLVGNVFADTPQELLDHAVASTQDQVAETFTWNRRMRRRFERSSGLVVHLFSGEARKAFDLVSEKHGYAHVPVDSAEDLLSDCTYQFLMRQAARGRVRAIVGVPPGRTFAPCRYTGDNAEGLRPIRVRGESLGAYGIEDLSCQELAQRGTVGLLMRQCVKPEQGYASLWATPEWLAGFQSRPCTKGKELAWSEWSPGLLLAVNNMLGRAFAEAKSASKAQVRSIDSGFIEHLRNNHTPFRRDCKQCIRGGARHKQHRKVLAPQGWCMSIDTAGPFPKGLDENTTAAKYLIVAVLSVPILSVKGESVDEPADRDPQLDLQEFAESLDDREWFVERGMELEEPLPEPTHREITESKDSWATWEAVVRKSRKDWLEEAKTQFLPKVEMIDFVYTEAVDSKKQQVVAGAISRMYARAISDGLSVQRIHTDRGKEYRNSALDAFCQKLGVHHTYAMAEEHQTNGRAEGAILKIKNRTRAILEGSGQDDLSEWPLAAKLASYHLRSEARKKLRMPCEPTVPFNTEVEVLQRSWRRGVWSSRTTTAVTKCPSSETSRGWVVKTAEGQLFTTSRLFPSIDGNRIRFKYEGTPLDLDAPSVRIREKGRVRKLGSSVDGVVSKNPAERLARSLYEAGSWEPKDVASLAVAMSKHVTSNSRAVVKDEFEARKLECNFLSGAFTYSGLAGIRSSTTEFPWVTRYLCSYLARHTDEPFAGVGLALNVDHKLHRDVHNQREIANVVLPIVSSGGGLWIQSRDGLEPVVDGPQRAETRTLENGTEVAGQVVTYESHKPISFHAHVWHESVASEGPQLLLFGYTARHLHKLKLPDRKALWDAGFTYVPGNKTEYWGYKSSSGTIVRYHPVPRRHMYAPTDQDQLPFARSCIGDLRLCVQQFSNRESLRSFHNWRQGRGRASVQKWTGWSAFTLRSHGPSCVRSGGGDPPQVDSPQFFDNNQSVFGEACEHSDDRSNLADCRVGVTEVSHVGERLAMMVPVEVGAPSSKSTSRQCAVRNQQGFVAVPRPRARARSLPRGSGLGPCDGFGSQVEDCGSPSDGSRGRDAVKVGGPKGHRTALSPASVVHWGRRYAVRHRIQSLRTSTTETQACDQGLRAAEVAGSQHPGMRCDTLVNGMLVKSIEVETRPLWKTTVCDEFPAKCPKGVMYRCLSLELTRMIQVLKGVDQGVVDEDGGDGDLLPCEVPCASKGLRPCASATDLDGVEYVLERTSWPMTNAVDEVMSKLTVEHQRRCSMLEDLSDDLEGWLRECEDGLLGEIQSIERELGELRKVEVHELRSLEGAAVASFTGPSLHSIRKYSVSEEPSEPDEDVPPLQTKIIASDQVRKELPKWIPPMAEEYEAVVSKTEAVEELDDEAYQALVADPTIVIEQIPGKLVYVHKPSGRRKARIVGCGNYCGQSGEGDRSELYASGASADTLRLMLRRCALESDWVLCSVDVRTAFLNAPLLSVQRGGKRVVTVVRVPSILREAGVTKCKFWQVRKALYGLASAPKSWACHRDKVIAEMRIPFGNDTLILEKAPEDANLLHIVKVSPEHGREEKLGAVALYVDDILIGSRKEVVEVVIQALQSRWELSPPEWVSEAGDRMKFAGFELERTPEGIRVHQESYVQDLLDQYSDDIPGIERVPAIKIVSSEEEVDDEQKRRLVKRAQTLTGQLLWVANRTRPDVAYAVSMASQRIVPNPSEAVARAEHIIKYLRGTPSVGLHYKPVQGKWGKWNQLKFQETALCMDAFSDASFAADEQSRSYGCIQLFWGGALVAWSASRQTLIASHTAECELYSLAEAHLLGKWMRPTVAALMDVSERTVEAHLYCDNSAAIQLCVLESGSWRTRHLRLRGAVVRSDLDDGSWTLTHVEGVYMPADLGTKPVGPARLQDLIKICDLWAPGSGDSAEPPRPQVAGFAVGQHGVIKALLALLLAIQVSGAKAVSLQDDRSSPLLLWQSFIVASTESLETGERERSAEEQLPFQADQEHLWDLYEQLYEEQVRENRRVELASGSSGLPVEWRPLPGHVDPAGSPEVLVAASASFPDALEAYWQGPELQHDLYLQDPRIPPPDMVANARAPTVPMPPGYHDLNRERPEQQQNGPGNRFGYIDDEVEIGSAGMDYRFGHASWSKSEQS